MAGNARFHNKWHRRNHHSLPSSGYPDSATDPIASAEEPFIGDFILTGSLSARKNAYIDGDTTIQGNLSVLGALTYLDTIVSVTSALSVVNHGTETALTVVQYGETPIAHFIDGDATGEGRDALFIGNEGRIVIAGTETASKYDPAVKTDVPMQVTINGNAYSNRAFIYERPDANTIYVSTTGSDTNSGLNPSQKVRTIKKAAKIAFDVYGVNKCTIQVEAGDYTEINPIYIPAGTSIIGNAFLRRNILRPYHKQLDFFWLNNACYLWGFTFRDTWAPCAATAFPNLLSSTPAYQIAFNTPGYEIDTTKPGGAFGLPIVSKPFITTSPYTQGMSSITKYQVVPIQPDLYPSYIQPGAQSVDLSRTDGYLVSSYIVSDFNTVINIIQNGNNPLPPIEPFAGLRPGATDAIALLVTNRSVIQDAVIRYVNDKYPIFAYDQAKCYRDVGFLIDALIYDLTEGTNLSAVDTGNLYFNGTGGSSRIPGQQLQTIDAIKFASELCLYVTQNRIYPWYEQRFDLTKTSGGLEGSNITTCFGVINNIIKTGIGNLPAPISLPVTAGSPDAVSLINLNKPFIQKTVVQYVNKTFPGFAYNQELCERDVGLILDVISEDITNHNTLCSINAGSKYYTANNKSLILGQEIQTIAALNYANFLTQKAITNTIAVTSQSFSPFLSSGVFSRQDMDDSYDNVTKIILTGELPAVQFTDNTHNGGAPAAQYVIDSFDTVSIIISSAGSVIPAITPPTGPVPGAADASYLLTANKEYIKRLTIKYLDRVFPDFKYNVEKCKRDVGLIIDCVNYDITNGTNLSSVQAGEYYLDGNGGTIITGQEIPTVAALNFARDLAVICIKNQQKSIFGQTFDLTKTNGKDVSNELTTAYTLISGTILNGIGSYTPSPATFTVPVPGGSSANYLLVNNKQLLQGEVINYVNITYPDFEYDVAKCYRDVGFITDAVATDVTTGNYLSSTVVASFYYNGTVSRVKGQQKETSAALGYANLMSQNIVQNKPIPSRYDAASLLSLNKVFLQKEVIEYMDKAYPAFVYDKVKCERDVGFIVDSVVYDITNGTDLSSISAGAFYLNGALPGNQKYETIAAINYAKYLSKYIIENKPVERIDAGCGIRVDGELALGFLRSFVTDSFTQFNAGGKGIHIINCGYAQLVSTFTICTTEGIFTENGGQCSISTSNCSFGLSGLVADGKSKFPLLTGYQYETTPLAENFLIVQGVTPKPLSAFVAALQSGIELEGIPVLEPYNGLLVRVEDDPASEFDEFLNPDSEVKYHGIKAVSALGAPYPPYTYRLTLESNIQAPLTASIVEPKYVRFFLRSLIATSSHAFEYIGTGVDLELAVPSLGGRPKNDDEAVFSRNGIVYYSSTNERGDFKVGGGFSIVQEKGTVEGVDFNKSILALVTPLILSLD